MLHSFSFSWQGPGIYISDCFLLILLCGQPGKVHYSASSLFSLFLVTITRSGRLAEIRGYVCISKSPRRLCVSFTETDSGLCMYHLFRLPNFNFLHNFRWITWSTHSCLVLYSFWASLLHSLIMWLIVSSLSPDNLHLLLCCVLSILALI